MSEWLPIEERTQFLEAARFGFDDRQEIENVLAWLTDAPDDAAAYIVWLENQLTACGQPLPAPPEPAP